MTISDLTPIVDNGIPAFVMPDNFYSLVGVVIDINFNCHDLKSGDLYVGKRNGGWELGVCYKVNHYRNYIMCDANSPFGMIYSYNINECYKVVGIVKKFYNDKE